MPADLQTAKNEIFGAFWAEWQNLSPVPVVFWDEVGQTGLPEAGTNWAAAFINHRSGTQAALTDSTIGRRFRNAGIVTIQIFGALPGPGQAIELAEVAVRAFQGKATENGVWFRNVRVEEVGPEAGWFQVNVVAEFEYDQPRS